MIPVSNIVFLGLSLLILVFAVFFLRKVMREIRLVIYGLLNDVSNTRQETSVLFAQIQALLALERKLDLSEALPPMRGWAGSPDFLLVVANEILTRKPQTIMECSSGVSTVVIARCLQMNGCGHVYSLEHDINYANKTRQLLVKYDLSEWSTVLDAPLETKHTETPWYSESMIPNNLSPIDILIIDGPPAQTAHLARFPALPRLQPRLSKNALIILDDAHRDDELEIVNRWKNLFSLQETNMNCEKGCILLEF
ncbi:class I SAM-dependent methyltransferase [Chromatium okenii]|jgi:predicted O-methyltransferase YrrM|uniref:class I SAM-dependent methyltransferase n=1 Tax=Chromatium okenii TaxID=61644 RepID=UPI0026E98451|nr:class I SAM-dependent methyltransferase [Chromatium okenii]